MSSSKATAVSLHSSARHQNGNVRDLNAAWKALSQSKVALRHIENRLEATPGTGVLLESVMDPKKHTSRKLSRRAGRGADDAGGSSKRRGHGNHSPEKSSSRSPLRNTTLDSNVRRNNVEFREPLASFREATPPPLQPSQLEACSTQSVSGPSLTPSQSPSDPSLSQLVYQRDTRDRQTDGDQDSTHSSALASTEVRYLNDRPALDATRPQPVQPALAMAGEDCNPRAPPCASHMESLPSAPARGDLSASSSPGSASQRLENLRRRQPDEKLEKLKERIRKQREHLEEAAERDKLLGYLEQPILGALGSSSSGTVTMPKAKVRKVAPAPPAPVYKGFNSSETKIKTVDGKVWKEEEFHNLSRDFYRDLSRQLAESSRHQHQSDERGTERPKDRRPPKPVRKVHRSSEPHPKQVIGPASWREGQKLVKMVLGPALRQPEEGRPQTSQGPGPAHRSSSDPRPEPTRRPRPNSTERPRSGRGRSNARSHTTSTQVPQPAAQEEALVAASTELLSADIQGILDDLQMECREAEEEEERARERSGRGHSGTRGRGASLSRPSRAPGSGAAPTAHPSRGSRSGSPAKWRAERPTDAVDAEHRKRHYDADTVRQYIVHQQEERRRRQMEERRAQREEAERRNQRLQELYRKQRVVAKAVALPSEAPVATVQRRLQETFTKLLLEEAQLEAEAEHAQPAALPTNYHLQRPMYQPSGESDKENKRLEVPQSPSSSDRSLSEQPHLLSRNDLDMGVPSWLQPDRTSVASRPATNGGALAPPGDHLFSEILRLETEAVAAAAAGHAHHQHLQSPGSNRSRSKMSRIDAIKASAASLSNRIESEARKLAGEGTNYGALTSMDADVVLAPQHSPFNQEAGRWASAASPPVRETITMPSDNLVVRIQRSEDLAIRIQKILSSADQSSFDGDGFPGVGNLHSYRRPSVKKSPASATDLKRNSYHQEGRNLLNGLEKVQRLEELGQLRGLGANGDGAERRNHGKEPHIHDSSGGSISEGPLPSDEDPSPPRRATNHVPRMADGLAAVDYCAARQREAEHPLAQFQREAERYSAISPAAPQRNGTRAAWEELSKGSPLSVINIYAKNLHSHLKAPEEEQEGTSPSARSAQSGVSPGDAAAYEDDFVSSRSSGATGQSKKRYSGHSSVKSHFEELMRRSPYDKRMGDFSSPHPSHHSSLQSPHLSSGSSSVCRGSRGKRGTTSDRSDATVVEEQKSPCSPHSEAPSADSRKRGSERSSAHSQPRSNHSDGTLGGAPEPSPRSLGQDGDKSPAVSPALASLPGTPAGPGSPPDGASPGVSFRSGSSGGAGSVAQAAGPSPPTRSPPHAHREETTGERQYAPGVLRQRMTAELSYLESIEESVRQLGDVERLRGVSMAQQESVSLAQILKAQQQRHERELYELKIKAEREALETQLHMEESRQRAARAHAELQESMAVNHQQTLGGLQEASAKMISQQAEAARYTADAARHIKEMAELTRSQMVPGDLTGAAESQSRTVLDQHKSHYGSHKKSPQARTETDSSRSEESRSRTMPGEPLSSLDSLSHSDSLPYRRPEISGGDSSSYLDRSHDSSAQRDWRRMDGRKEKAVEESREPARRGKEATGNSSVEEEAPTAADDSLLSESIHSVLNEKDSTSVATDYSLKFDESMTEDDIEERSFRSLLPSEAHRRGTLDKKSRPHEESEEEPAAHDRSLASVPLNGSKDVSKAFASGQDSFTQFTMDMVRQYMVDEEVRLQHQGSLLHLRQKALKEKTKTEMAWLEHQKRRLRDKGEDDKMPPIRKKQRGLLMKLQQEQAEIKRLQEANKAARKERLLLLKQQEEIERMRSSTLRLKERLKSAGGDAPPETPMPETPVSEVASPSLMLACRDPRSPSPPLSVSGSETSSIMQKLKKMHSHADEKFLTKREQQLLQRRHHAAELLQWKQRLDQEEAEVRRMEKEALGVWDRQAHLQVQPGRRSPEPGQRETSDISTSSVCRQSQEPLSDEKKGSVGEEDYSTVSPERSGSSTPASPSTAPPASVPETSMASFQSSQDITSASPSPGKPSPPAKAILSTTASTPDCSGGSSSRTKMLLRSPPRPSGHTPGQARTKPSDPPAAKHTDPMSDQSDIESRIRALKEELKKRKSMAYQLKKEQKKRHKERLKAQEASLLKQLESYDDFIQKTKAELNKEPGSKSAAELQLNAAPSATERRKPLPPHSSDSSRRSRAVSDSEEGHSDVALDHGDQTPLGRSRSTSLPEELSEEDTPTVTPTPAYGSPERPSSGVKALGSPDGPSRTAIFKGDQHRSGGAEDKSIVSNHRSDISEDLAQDVSSKSGDGHSECLLKLEMEDGPISHQDLSVSNHVPSENEDNIYSPSGSLQDDRGLKIRDSSLPGEPKQSWRQDVSSSSSDNASLSSKIEAPIKDTDASRRPSVTVTDGYHDDFESSVESSPRDDRHISQPASPVSPPSGDVSRQDSYSRFPLDQSKDEEVEEDIAGELSEHSVDYSDSRHSGKLLDLNNKTAESKGDTRNELNHSPALSPPQTRLSPVVDEMPTFSIGDRVLVSNVQPGTLRFKGPTRFANGFWAGVELDKSEGSNNGTYDGVVYFVCEERHGIFAPSDKIVRLPDKFDVSVDTTEDEDSFVDDLSERSKHADEEKRTPRLRTETEEESPRDDPSRSGYKEPLDEADHPSVHHQNKDALDEEAHLNSHNHLGTHHSVPNGQIRDGSLEFDNAPTTLLISDLDKMGSATQRTPHTGYKDLDSHYSPVTPNKHIDVFDVKSNEGKAKQRDSLGAFADTLLNNFVKDTVMQLNQVKLAKERKIMEANRMNGELFTDRLEGEGRVSPSEQKDGLPFFLETEKEELSSPELCNRPESPVLGASGQEELAKRLAELELSRELLDDIGDDQDWFEEDFGLKSRREQQRRKQRQREEEEEDDDEENRVGVGRPEQQPKTPPRPELPLPLLPKLPEQPAMVVPHSATEVERLVHAATAEIWETCSLGRADVLTLAGLPVPRPSLEYLGKEANGQDQEDLCIRSYRQGVYDLTWEILQEIFGEDPNANQPLWLKPRRVNSSYSHRVRMPGNISKVQEFIATKVLKLYGLRKDQSQKTDWQKMLKFGRKKRDRVDHILVQELHEEEAQWVNYDEDELFVKMQLADSIFDMLLKDTADVLTQIHEQRSARDALS